jgi:peptidoglycan/LPS O-acetylase OafA/YrhL
MTSASRPASLETRFPSLDGLRGVAVLLVLTHNMTLLDVPTNVVEKVIEYCLNVGWIGVQLFFVLSGFLITRGLIEIRESRNYYVSFYGRRVLRIFPLYFGTLAFIFVVLPALNAMPDLFQQDAPHQVWLWTFLSNWSEPRDLGGSSLPHFWSLAVEEQFYLIWPLLIHRLKPRQIATLCAVVAALSLGARVWMVQTGVDPEIIYAASLARMDALAMGAAVASLLAQPEAAGWARENIGRLLTWTLVFGITGWLVSFGYQRTSRAEEDIGYSLLALSFAGTVLCCVLGEHRQMPLILRWTQWSWLRSVGVYSYAMYVFHKPLHDVFHARIAALMSTLPGGEGVHTLVYLGLMCSAMYLLARLSWWLVEKRFLSQKWRFRPRFST